MSCLRRDNNTRASSQGIEREAVAKLLMNLPPPSFKNIKKKKKRLSRTVMTLCLAFPSKFFPTLSGSLSFFRRY